MVRNSANLSILHLHVAATHIGYVVSTIHQHNSKCSKCMCAVMGYSLHKGQYVHVCSNGVQFTRGSMCVCAVMGYSLQGAVCACVQ